MDLAPSVVGRDDPAVYSPIVQWQNIRLLIGMSLVRVQLGERNKFFARWNACVVFCSAIKAVSSSRAFGRVSYRGLAKRSGDGLQNRIGGFDSRNHVNRIQCDYADVAKW